VTAVASLTRVRVVIDHTMPTPLQRSTKLNISHWYFDQCLHPIKTSSSVKKHLEQAFFYVIFFSHSHPFNEMFVVSGRPKSHCCNNTFTDVRFTSLLAKNQHFISYFAWNFHSNWLLFLRVMQEKKSGRFVSEHSVVSGICLYLRWWLALVLVSASIRMSSNNS